KFLAFMGDGKLKDNSQTSFDFREFLTEIPSDLIVQFTNYCLSDSFADSGLALQDIINEIGSRLSFTVKSGLYRGNQNEIGYDGIWTCKDGYGIVVEVKTTDSYRINLDTIANYRRRLIDNGKIDGSKSSILIVVGRQDTGDLEAQIRGSRHAWDIRLLSSDALMNLLFLKETLNDNKTIQQITELLKPREYTRIDKLIELIFQTTKDFQLETTEEEVEEVVKEKKKRKASENKISPVNFHLECLEKIRNKLQLSLIKQSKISYSNKDKSLGLIIAISKPYKQGQHEKYWFAFHPHQQEFLKEYENSFVAFGCGASEKTFLIPFNEFKPLVKNFWTTQNNDRMYWHVIIHNRDKKYVLQQPRDSHNGGVDITKYKI
ncbi:MAG: hypothetical protein C0412_06260, partial [Flavobacterium sp.]|nr:hypothetical protein [Flavobacterium sp.]